MALGARFELAEQVTSFDRLAICWFKPSHPTKHIKNGAGDGIRTHVLSLEGSHTSHYTTPARQATDIGRRPRPSELHRLCFTAYGSIQLKLLYL